MKKIIYIMLTAILALFIIEDKKDVYAGDILIYAYDAASSNLVSISTTPVLVNPTTDILRQSIMVCNPTDDSNYVYFSTYSVTLTSTTLVGNGGIPIFQNTVNNCQKFDVSNSVKIYAVRASDSGSSYLKVITFGQTK